MTLNHLAAAAAIALAATVCASPFDTADARTRTVRATLHGAHGSATAVSHVTRTRHARACDTVITGQNGRERTIHDERTWNRRAGTFTHNEITTFNDGSTRRLSVNGQRVGAHQYALTREITGRNGETRTQTGQFNVERTGSGRIVNGEVQTQNHGEIDVNRQITHANGVRTANTTATFEDGRTIISNATRSRSGNDVSHQRNTTFADGTSRSIERERDGNGDGDGTITRTVTGRDGRTRTQTGEYEVSRTP